MSTNCSSCGTPLHHRDEACPNCLPSMAERPPTFPNHPIYRRDERGVKSGSRTGSSGLDGIGERDDSNLGGEEFWNERKEYIQNDPMFHTYYGLYRNGVDLNELKDNMITQLLKIKKDLTERLIDAESRVMPKNLVGEI